MNRSHENPIINLNKENIALLNSFQVIPPANIDLFMAGADVQTHLTREITENPKVVEEAKDRRFLFNRIEELFGKVSDEKMEISAAIKKELVDQEDLTEVYDHLNKFIKTDTNNARIILYLPFEILPNLKQTEDKSKELIKAEKSFGKTYKDSWFRLLYESEIRASFTNGDILKPGVKKPECVRKAAHLIPEILDRGIIEPVDLINLLDLNDEDELLKSLTEGITVAIDGGFVDKVDSQRIQSALKEKKVDFNFSKKTKKKKKDINLSLALKEIELKYQKGSPYISNFSKNRIKWKKETEKEELIEQFVDQLVNKIDKKEMSLEDIILPLIKLKTIFKIGKKITSKSFSEACEFVKRHQPLIQKQWESNSIGIKDIIVSGLSHWEKLRIVDKSVAKSLNIKIPDFSLLSPINYDEIISEKFGYLKDAAEKIKKHPLLSKFIYPLFLVYGSVAKGQDRPSTDHDVEIFLKENAPFKKRKEILKILSLEIPEISKVNELFEFWTKKNDGKINFRHIENRPKTVASPSQHLHILLSGIWVGNGKDIKKLQGDILEKYLDLSRLGQDKDEARFSLLREVEADTLQFRLMHKGYKYFYPNKKEEGTKNSDLIDWDSDFWDPGFRRLATKLFLSKVFLPDLSQK